MEFQDVILFNSIRNEILKFEEHNCGVGDEAIRFFNTLLSRREVKESRRTSAFLWKKRAAAYLCLDLMDEAVQDLDKVQQCEMCSYEFEDAAMHFLFKGNLAFEVGDYEDARKYYMCTENSITDVIVKLETIAKAGICLYETGQLDRAKTYLRRQYFQPDLAWIFFHTILQDVTQGEEKFFKGNYQKALSIFNRIEFFFENNPFPTAVVNNTPRGEVHCRKALVYHALGDQEKEARKEFAKLNPNSEVIKKLFEKCHEAAIKKGTDQESITMFSCCYFLCSKLPDVSGKRRRELCCNLVDLFMKTNDFDKATKWMDEAKKASSLPNKDIARKWKDYGNKIYQSKADKDVELAKESYSLAYDLAMDNDTELLRALLANISLMNLKMGSLDAAVRNAKECIKRSPKWSKGYLRLGKAYQEKGETNKAWEVLCSGLAYAENKNNREELLESLVRVAGKMTGAGKLPDCITRNQINTYIASLWEKSDPLLYDGLKCLALSESYDMELVNLQNVVEMDSDPNAKLLEIVLEKGIRPMAEAALLLSDTAVKKNNSRAVVLLIKYGFNFKEEFGIKEDDPPLHKALKLALHGYVNVLSEALAFSEFNRSAKDRTGQTILHLLANGNNSLEKVQCLNTLIKSGFAASKVKNSDEKTALETLVKDDDRYKLVQQIEEISHVTKPRQEVQTKGRKKSQPSTKKKKGGGATQGEGHNVAAFVASGKSSGHDLVLRIPSSRGLPLPKKKSHSEYDKARKYVCQLVTDSDLQTKVHEMESLWRRKEKEIRGSSGSVEKDGIIPDKFKSLSEFGALEVDVIEEVGTANSNVEDISLDGEDWEIECTTEVVNALTIIHPFLVRRVIDRLKRLTTGNWKDLAIPVEARGSSDLKLYTTQITHEVTLLWEDSVAFSARQSIVECADKDVLLTSVYESIIRVWCLLFDDTELSGKVKMIEESHRRGSTCLAPKNLRRKNLRPTEGLIDAEERRPCCSYEDVAGKRHILHSFVSQDGTTNNPRTSRAKSGLIKFYPPASPNDREFHILKFYSLSSSMAKSLLKRDVENKCDFPFKVSDLEFAVIKLTSENKCPTLLLGRSGTGKTTCCLYRLWNQFKEYWEEAIETGPSIPKIIMQDNLSLDSDGDTECIEQNEVTEDIREEKEPIGDENKNVAWELLEEKPGLKCGNNQHLDLDSLIDACQCEGACNCYIVSGHEVKKDLDLNGQLLCNGYRSDEAAAEHLKVDETLCEVEKTDDSCDSEPDIYEHLRQVFITRNQVLCGEVGKTFGDLLRGFPKIEEKFKERTNRLPLSFDEVTDDQYPLFLTSHQWLLLLDATLPGKSFFPRDEEKKLLYQVPGWNESSKVKSFLHQLNLDRLDNDTDSDEDASDNSETEDKEEAEKQKKNKEISVMREVTYDVFLHEFWREIKKKQAIDCHPSLVWNEICSYIKGAIEALSSKEGYLTFEKYEQLGKKFAPNFVAERSKIYKLFVKYQKRKARERMFDEADVMHNIYHRMIQCDYLDWTPHQIYVDETQDFSQAELFLLICSCRNPNAVFLTGDTAQSITRGISFRFKDVKSLFYTAKKNHQAGEEEIRMPNGVYQLLHNYRSHNGILNLAASVIDVLKHYFPRSFDHLKRDIGMFPGPKPIILETKSPSELAVILQGSKREASTIEFGAHQVVLVSDEETKRKIPEELSCALVLTIFEAKGLEFDDVLLYNFFSSSQAKEEWRLVKTYMDFIIASGQFDPDEIEMDDFREVCGIAFEDEDEMEFNTRPLDFKEKEHKILNSELKQLYTALTRARVNVWIFDDNEEKRTPMFEYFVKRRLVEVIKVDPDDLASYSTKIFAKASTPEDWFKQGKYFYNHEIWEVAATCFDRSGDTYMMNQCLAHQQAMKAYRMGNDVEGPRTGRLREVCTEYLKAAVQYLETGLSEEATLCLRNAREWGILGELLERKGKVIEAAKCYQKDKQSLKASRLFRLGKDYRNAVDVACKENMTEEAIGYMLEFRELKSKGNTAGVRPPRSTIDIKSVCHKAADAHYEQKDLSKMAEVLERCLSCEQQLEYLSRKRGCFDLRVETLKKYERYEEACRLLNSQNRFTEVAAIYHGIGQEKKVMEAYMSQCKMILCNSFASVKEPGKYMGLQNPEMIELVTSVLEKINDWCEGNAADGNFIAMSRLLFGILYNSKDRIKEAKDLFAKAGNVVSCYIVSVFLRQDAISTNVSFLRLMEKVWEFVQWLTIPAKETTEMLDYQKALGWSQIHSDNRVVLHLQDQWQYKMMLQLLGVKTHGTKFSDTPVQDGREAIAVMLVKSLVLCSKKVREVLIKNEVASRICPKFLHKIDCDRSCGFCHSQPCNKSFKRNVQPLVEMMAVDALCRHCWQKLGHLKSKFTSICPDFEEVMNVPFIKMIKPFDKLFSLIKTYEPFLRERELSFQTLLGWIPSKDFKVREQTEWYLQEIRREWKNDFIPSDLYQQIFFFSQSLGSSPSHCDLITADQCLLVNRIKMSSNNPIFKCNRTKSQVLLMEYMLKSKDALHKEARCDVSMFWSMERFLSMTVSETKDYSLVGLDFNLFLGILKFEVTLCHLIASKLACLKQSRVSLDLPSSYFESFQFWDDLCKPAGYRKPWGGLDAVRRIKMTDESWKIERIENRVFRVVIRCLQFLTGSFSRNMNLVDAIFSVRNTFKNIREQAVLLCLVLMVNMRGISAPLWCIKELVKQIKRYNYLDDMPTHISLAIIGIQTSVNSESLRPTLHKFLEDTNNPLLQIRWDLSKNEPHFTSVSRQTQGLNFVEKRTDFRESTDATGWFGDVGMTSEVSGRSDGSGKEHVPVKILQRENIVEEESAVQLEVDKDEEIEFERDESDLIKKEESARKIQRWFRRFRKNKPKELEEDISESDRAPLVDDNEYQGITFSFVPSSEVTEKCCNICGVNFEETSEYTLPVDKIPAVHIQGQQHKEQKVNYDNFILFKEGSVEPCLVAAEGQLDRLYELEGTGIDCSTLQGYNIENRIKALKDTCEGLETKRLWEERESMQTAVDTLNDAAYKLEKEIDHRNQELQGKAPNYDDYRFQQRKYKKKGYFKNNYREDRAPRFQRGRRK